MHLIHRNRADHFADAPRNISPLRSPFPRGARLISVALVEKTSKTDTIITFAITVNLTIRLRAESLAPLWEDICKQIRPQRKKNANTWSDFLTRLRWMRCIKRTLFHIFVNAKELSE